MDHEAASCARLCLGRAGAGCCVHSLWVTWAPSLFLCVCGDEPTGTAKLQLLGKGGLVHGVS